MRDAEKEGGATTRPDKVPVNSEENMEEIKEMREVRDGFVIFWNQLNRWGHVADIKDRRIKFFLHHSDFISASNRDPLLGERVRFLVGQPVGRKTGVNRLLAAREVRPWAEWGAASQPANSEPANTSEAAEFLRAVGEI